MCASLRLSYSEDFSRYFPPLQWKSFRKKSAPSGFPAILARKDPFDAINTYKLASYCGALKKEKHIILAGICLRIAWLYRIKQNKEQEERFLKFALKEYEASYSTGDFSGTQVSEARILYLAGEISRRIGNEKAAIRYFSFVFGRQKNAREASSIQMAKDRFQELKRTQETPHPLLQH
ncbi:DUF2225 domain-containing protein [Peribacillus frigoritolerans]|uniref:DUF2225 domain-containing protein n=1 Tax=Peribacillus castrilensis TaxID=2897690 RepID=A0AAW9N0F2_9BACI|nr:DUF2225 domain-containing protein [Peribacillus castrilensis]